jgi:hypothetical protein
LRHPVLVPAQRGALHPERTGHIVLRTVRPLAQELDVCIKIDVKIPHDLLNEMKQMIIL